MNFKAKASFLMSIALLTLCLAFATMGIAAGRFEGKIITEWLEEGDHRFMKVHKSFVYVDSDSRRWSVPAGIRIDGASIPKIFWSIVGGPFEGLYRDASVVHDYYCDRRSRSWEDVHKVFYDAMLARGVSAAKAWLMYRAVLEFGPRWPAPKIDPKCLKHDGGFDYKKCTENNDIRPEGKITFPEVTRERLLNFLQRVEAEANLEDIQLLRKEAERL
jgi:hypothetical protein